MAEPQSDASGQSSRVRFRLFHRWVGRVVPNAPRRLEDKPPYLTELAAKLLQGALLALAFALVAFAAPLPAAESSVPARLASRAPLLDVARAGSRLVAVGDYGTVVVSSDEGKTWRQVIVPALALLTGVSFADERHGWAVGHDGVILATADGGESWTRLDAGNDVETVFLDVLFLDVRRGFAVGAYGRFLATEDGGKTWQARKPSDEDLHLNRITAAADGRLFLAGEAGTVLVSADSGLTWSRSELPYDGSLFGVLPLDDNGLVAFGLRGHILTSKDGGGTWEEPANPITALIMAGTRLRDGRVLLAGLGGNFFLRSKDGGGFRHFQPAELGTGVADMIETKDGALVTVGEGGAVRLDLP